MRKWRCFSSVSSISTTSSEVISPFKLNYLLQLCSGSKSLAQGRQVHQHVVVHGLGQDTFMTTKLVQLYADCDDLSSAHILFDKLSLPNVFAWTAVLALYSRNGMADKCIQTYREMKVKSVVPDHYVFPKVLRACAQSVNLELGIQVHKDLIACGAELNVQACNSLIDMYAKCEDVESARWVFDQMSEKDILSWNSMISGYVCTGFLTLAVEMCRSMRLEGFEPDLVTWNTIMDAYCRMGQCNEAGKIFEQIKEPNIISWTTLISGYSRIGQHVVTLGIFRNMLGRGEVFADLDCLSSVLVSCRHLGALRHGQEIHAHGIKLGTCFAFNNSAGPALLTVYARCRRIQDVRNLFDLMDKSDVVNWNAMIFCFANLGMRHSALECFRKMQVLRIQSNQTTISTVLPACELNFGKQIHAYVRKSSFTSDVSISNALIHMYSKCGTIETAYSVFSEMINRDLITWNTMIGGFGMHGFGRAALQLLQEMNNCGLCPNSVTLTSVLSACSHSGLVDEGLKLFHQMTVDFSCKPGMEHFACVVDLLARAGRLEDAVAFTKRMPVAPDKHIWGALLAASQAYQNTGVGMLAAENLVHLEPKHAGHHVTLSNIYARAGRWDDSVRVRKLMERRGFVKPLGYSWIESE